ncbi:hypothetical protein C8F04DRAFT_1120728 [Mycena alexandri]|uniref:Uncharacterized protein n=1 Tax=Mycena alexandri TaxID=1745969 RepID=A0AAD6SI95_9AGAR|nr:hypothetical protein C8F04DRAFT_1120728 [Mycena alexandri]
MASFESALYYSNPGEERLRLWRMEQEPQITLKFKEMQRDINARFGRKIRESLSQAPHDHQTVLQLWQEAEEEETQAGTLLHEGVEAQAAIVKADYLHAALSHPGEADPEAEIRQRIMDSSAPGNTYCSPVLMNTLFWAGMNELPNTHRKRLELDFPERVDALLDFHCIAFHADIDVMKELYDDGVPSEKRKEVLAAHQVKMQLQMVDLAEKMHISWVEEKDRQRQRSAQSPAASSTWVGTGDWIASPPAPSDGVRRRAHINDPPTILGAAEQKKSSTASSQPLHGILKKMSTATSGLGDMASTFEDDTGLAGSFAGPYLLDEATANRELGEYQMSDVVEEPPIHRRWASTSSQQPMFGSYEIYHPKEAVAGGIPRSVSNVGRLTQSFEERIGRGKGKGRKFNVD